MLSILYKALIKVLPPKTPDIEPKTSCTGLTSLGERK